MNHQELNDKALTLAKKASELANELDNARNMIKIHKQRAHDDGLDEGFISKKERDVKVLVARINNTNAAISETQSELSLLSTPVHWGR
jgi:hypothetical protein